MNNVDLAALLENNFLAYIRTSSLFFVAGLALFNFTNLGKNFSLISLTIGLLLIISVVVDYFFERSRIAKLGFYPRTIVDILAYILIAVIFLFMWVIYSAWNTTPTSIAELFKNFDYRNSTSNINTNQENIIFHSQKQQNTLTNASLASTS